MRIATWNVNSIKARLPHVTAWLARVRPDVLMLQELKGLEFPAQAFADIGYQSAFVAQKAYNGVATLSRHPIETLLTTLPGDEADSHARYLETAINGLRLVNIYLPNGNPVDSEKFPYKLAWMDRLKTRLAQLRLEGVPVAIGGDFNVIPEVIDCFNPKFWEGDALFRAESRGKFRALLNLGYTDAFRVHNRQGGQFTFWDYFGGAFENNRGIRIDHFLLAPALADRLVACTIDAAPRALEKPSDHTPVMIELADAA